jgi:hypothetical protein
LKVSPKHGGTAAPEPPVQRRYRFEAEPILAEKSWAEPIRAEPSWAEPIRAEPHWAEPILAEPSWAEPNRAV